MPQHGASTAPTQRYRAPASPLRYRPGPAVPSAVPAPERRAGAGLSRVATLLTPDERLRVDAAGAGVFVAHHCDTMRQASHDLAAEAYAALVVSLRQLDAGGRGEGAQVREVVRRFPRVPVVALLGESAAGSPQQLLTLGRAGVRLVVDAGRPSGWQALRDLLGADPLRQVGREAMARIGAALAGADESCLAFFAALFDVPPEPVTVQMLAHRLGVRPTTLTSRFARAGLPSPKRYLAVARLARAARLLENRGWTLSATADQLDYSSAQSFGRHVRTLLGISAAEFRRTRDAESMLTLFERELVAPHAERLRTFSPLRGG